MYSFMDRVRYSEADSRGRLKLSALVDYLQDSSIFHSEDVGYGVNHMMELGLAWMLISWQIVIDDMPKMAENIEVITNPYGFEKFFGYRNFIVKGQDGICCVRANSTWALMDMKSGRPVRVPQDMYTAYGLGEPWEMDYAPRKIDMTEIEQEMEEKGICWMRPDTFPVMPHHLDTNQHVNNGAYIHMAADFLPADFEIGQIRVEYKIQAKMGNQIYPRLVKLPDGRLIVDLCDDEEKSYAVVELMPRISASIK